MRVEWSDRALDQVRAIFDYIVQDRPNVAVDIANGLFDRVDQPKDTPEMGPIWNAKARSDLRSLLYTSYRIIYRVEPDQISVLSVRHTRRDIDASTGYIE